MHPRQFFEGVVIPNIHAVEAQADDMRAVVNAVLTLDALIGLLHAHLDALGCSEVLGISDEEYRERLGQQCPGYAALRDTAATLKHGRLTHPRRNRPPRLIKTLDRIQSKELVLEEFDVDDEIEGRVAILCLENGTNPIRVDYAIAEACRMLLPLLDSLPEPAGSAPV